MVEGFLSKMEGRLEGGPCVMVQAVGQLRESDFSAQLVMWRLAIQANAVDSSLKSYNIEVMFNLAFEFFGLVRYSILIWRSSEVSGINQSASHVRGALQTPTPTS